MLLLPPTLTNTTTTTPLPMPLLPRHSIFSCSPLIKRASSSYAAAYARSGILPLKVLYIDEQSSKRVLCGLHGQGSMWRSLYKFIQPTFPKLASNSTLKHSEKFRLKLQSCDQHNGLFEKQAKLKRNESLTRGAAHPCRRIGCSSSDRAFVIKSDDQRMI